MRDTYNMLNLIRTNEYSGLTNEQLALEYKKDLKPEVLAEMFCRNYTLLYNMSRRFHSVCSQDAASIITVSLDITMQKYDTSYGAKYMTFALKHILEAFTQEILKQNRVNRKINNESINLSYFMNFTEDEKDNSDSTILVDKQSDKDFDEVELLTTIENSSLSNTEKKICKLLITQPSLTREDIADIIGVSRQSVQVAVRNLKLNICSVLA